MCFDNRGLDLSTISWDTIFPIGTILYDTILPLGEILIDTISLLSMVLFDTVLPLDAVLFDVKGYYKEDKRTNFFGNIRDEGDLLVESNDDRCWSEERVWLNVVKYIAVSGEIIFARENETRSDS